MSKYYRAEDVQELITACVWRMTLAKERGGEGFVEYDKQIIDVDELRKRLSNLPTINIVHCGECKYYEDPNHKIFENCVKWKDSHGIILPIKPNDSCSYGERIEK